MVCLVSRRCGHGCPSPSCNLTTSRFLSWISGRIYNDIQTNAISTKKQHSEIEALVVATKEIGLEVNADKTKYMIMSQDQNTGRSYSMKIDNSSIERVEEFKYLGTTLTNKNSFRKKLRAD